MKSKLYLLSFCFLLSGCPTGIDSFAVRFWDGDFSNKSTEHDNAIWKICDKELSDLPRSTQQEREKASLERLKCLNRNKDIKINKSQLYNALGAQKGY